MPEQLTIRHAELHRIAFPGRFYPDLIHIDTKKLGRIEKTGHHATGDRRDRSRGAGWEVLFVAIDDHARIAYTEPYADESQESACRFLANAHEYYCSLGARPKALLADNGSALHAKSFNRDCTALELKHRYTLYAALSTTNQWEGRALHPVGVA